MKWHRFVSRLRYATRDIPPAWVAWAALTAALVYVALVGLR